MTSRTKALLAIILASLLWSTAGVAKVVIHVFDPYTAAFFRFFVASLVILPFFLKEKRGKRALLPLVPMTLMSTANIALYYVGLQTSTANAASLIYVSVPLLTAILSRRFLGEALGMQKLTGIIIGLIGVLVIVILPAIEKGQVISGGFPGNFFFVGAVLVWSFYTIGSRRAIDKQGYSPITVTGISIFTTTAVFFIISLFTFRTSYIQPLTNPFIVLLILHLGIFVTVATYLLFQWAVKHSSATTASFNVYLQPFFAVFFNILFLGEHITLPFILGTILVGIGVFVAGGSQTLREVRGWIKR